MRINNINCLGPITRKELKRQIAKNALQHEKKQTYIKQQVSDILQMQQKIPQKKQQFESKAESDFYYSEIWPKIQMKEIVKCELHKTFLLLDKSDYCNIKLPKAQYTPDFVLTYKNGLVEVIEVKSKTIRKLQRDYIYRRRLFIDKYCRPNRWIFRESFVK